MGEEEGEGERIIIDDNTNDDDYFCENADEEPQSPSPAATTADDDDDEPISYRNHLIDVTNITYPIILAEIFQNTLPLIDLAFVGMCINIDALTCIDQQTRTTKSYTCMMSFPFLSFVCRSTWKR